MNWASAAASRSRRTLLSLTSIGMFTPATTCAPVSRATITLMLVCVSPSMSVTMRTPWPRSTRRTAARMSSRMSCQPAEGALVTASTPSSGPTTFCRVSTMASLSRPCPTTTRPTIPPILTFGAGLAQQRPETTRDPRLRLGSDGEHGWTSVNGAGVVPRPAEPARQTNRSAEPLERAKLARQRWRHWSRASPCHVLPRRLRRPRHGSRTIHRTPHTRVPLRPETKSRVESSLQVPVAHEHAMAELREACAQRLDQHNRAVPSARAADGDGEIALPLVLVAGQREAEQREDVLQELDRVGAREDVLGDRRVGAGSRTQLLHEERVRQEAAVEDEVGVGRQPVLVAERHQRDRHRARLGALETRAQRRTQLVHGERAGVDDAVGHAAQGAERLALASDAVGERPALGGGMRAARLAETPHEHVVARLEIDDLEMHAARPQLLEDPRHLVQEAPLADVDAERDAPDVLPRALPQLEEARQQRHRQVVDAVEAEILEDAQRGALAGAGEAADDHRAQTRGHRRPALIRENAARPRRDPPAR